MAESKDASGHEHKGAGPGGGQFTGSGGGGAGKPSRDERQAARAEKKAKAKKAKARNRAFRKKVEAKAPDSPHYDVATGVLKAEDPTLHQRLYDLTLDADHALQNPKKSRAEKAAAYDAVGKECRRVQFNFERLLRGVDFNEVTSGSRDDRLFRQLGIFRTAARHAEARAEAIRGTGLRESKDASGHEHKGAGPGGGQFTGSGGAATNGPSKPAERHKVTPPVKPFKAPPPPQGKKGGGKPVRPTGD